jgi:hypothetical protein
VAITDTNLRAFLTEVCRCGLDRLPLRVRNLQIPFYFSGFDDRHVYLSHAESCMVSPFSFDDLEPLTVSEMADLQAVTMVWMGSDQYLAAQSLIESAQEVRRLRLKLPVTLSADSEPRTRHGHLNDVSGLLGGTEGKWVCAVETVEAQNVVFRYGLTRLARAMHDGKVLRMALVTG